MIRLAAKNHVTVAAALSLLLLGGCDVETFDDAVSTIDTPPGSPTPPSDPPSDPPPAPSPGGFNPVFSEVQSNVFTPDCATSGCHVGANPPAGLRWTVAWELMRRR